LEELVDDVKTKLMRIYCQDWSHLLLLLQNQDQEVAGSQKQSSMDDDDHCCWRSDQSLFSKKQEGDQLKGQESDAKEMQSSLNQEDGSRRTLLIR
jgi:hypothetical protein